MARGHRTPASASAWQGCGATLVLCSIPGLSLSWALCPLPPPASAFFLLPSQPVQPQSQQLLCCSLQAAHPRPLSQADPEGRKPHQLHPSCHISAADTSRMELWDQAWPPPPAPQLGWECGRRVVGAQMPPGYRGLHAPCRRNSRDPDPTKCGRHVAS